MRKLIVLCSLLIASGSLLTSCIEPPLKLPAEEVLVEVPTVITDMEVVWSVDADWTYQWHYGWDATDSTLFGNYDYPKPSNYEVRRYYLGEEPGGRHTNVDAFTIFTNRFRRSYQFGYYDMLLYSNIDSDDGTQVLVIDESDLDNVKASTTVSRGMTRLFNNQPDIDGTKAVTGLYNQPEIFYSAYPQDIYISRNEADYDYYDEEEKCWVKQINCELYPLVYIYLVQVIFTNNDGRVTGTSGNAALSAFARGTNVNTGYTDNDPVIVYFNTRYKAGIEVEGKPCDILGGKFTTFGLCDMPHYSQKPKPEYDGTRTDLPNYLMVDVRFRNGTEKTMQFDVTDQCRKQSHGGIITVVIDCGEIELPEGESGQGSLFVPTVEDYDEVIYDIPM